MKNRTLLFLCVFLVIFAADLAAGGRRDSSAPAASVRVSTVNVAVPALPETLEPGALTTIVMYRVSYNIFNNLIEFDFKGSRGLYPALAESWNQIDSQTLEVKLRKGVKFHNGDEFTAKDVAFTFSNERLFGENPLVGHTRSRSNWRAFDRVEIVDPYTVIFHTSEPDAVMVNRLTQPTFQIISEKAYREARSFEDWSFKPVGTGPYKVRTHSPADQLVLDAHTDYWGGKPAAETVIFRSIPEESARIAGLIAGDYHVISNVSIDLIPTIEADRNLEVVGGPSASYLATYFNMHKPYFDVKLRKAMNLALDRELLVKTLFAGRTRVVNGMQEPGYADMFVKEHPYPRFDLAEAKKLVNESVYNGEVINYWILNDYYLNEVNAAQAMVEMWRAAGINVQIEIKENFGQVNATGSDGKRLLGMRNSSHTDLYGDPSGCLWRTYNPRYDAQNHHNWKGSDVDEFNRMGAVLDKSINQQERYNAFKRMLEIMDNNPPAAILYQNMALSAKRASLDWSAYSQVYMYFGPENFTQ